MIETNSVEVSFLGQRVRLKSADAGSDSIREVAEFVTRKLSDAEARSRGGPAHQAALVALLEVSEDYLAAKKKVSELLQKIRDKSAELEKFVSIQDI